MDRTLRKTLALALSLFAGSLALAVTTIPRPADASDPLPAAAADPAQTAEGQEVVPGQDFVPGQVIVQYRDENAPQAITVPAEADVEQVAEVLEERPAIEYADPNYIARVSGWLPNDPGVNPVRRGSNGGWQRRQWNFLPCHSLCQGDAASNAPQSRGGMNVIRGWQHLRRAKRPGARGVRIAVLDSGIAYRNKGNKFRRNPDLAARTFLPGKDFVERDRVPLDLNGHGTHVAATIAQATNNRRGLTGIAYGARLIPVRVMDANGFGTTLNIVKGVRWAVNNGARVINMSLNFDCGASVPSLEDAIRFAHRKGVVVVGSAGNKSSQTCPSPPATVPQTISVGGSTESGCVADYSFRDARIDIVAPGGGPNGEACPFSSSNRPILQVAMVSRNPRSFGIEKIWNGTSMSAAHVSGAAAMVLASKVLTEKRGPRQVKERLAGTARLPDHAVGDPNSGFGAGMVNLGLAVNPNFALPGEPAS